MSLGSHYAIRAWYDFVHEVEHDGGEASPEPLIKAASAVVIKNPFAGQHMHDLSELIDPSAHLGKALGDRSAGLLRGRAVESYGKGGVVGMAGEQEHTVACVTSIFGNAFRDAIGGGEAWISSTTKSGVPGVTIDVPLAYKDEVYVRSHYDAITLTLPDAPRPDEIVVIAAVATGRRVHARVGGKTVAEVSRQES